VRHTRATLGEGEAIGLVEDWMSAIDRPSLDGLNTYAVAKAVRDRGIKVALSGLGGDELFGGYPSFRTVPWLALAAPVAGLAPATLRARLVDAATSRLPTTVRRKAHDFAVARPDALTYALLRRRLFSDDQMATLGFGGALDGLNETFVSDELLHALSTTTNAWAVVREVELRLYMGNVLLPDSDVFGMAHGLEIRVPLLDQALVEQVLTYARPLLSRRTHGVTKPWLVGAAGPRFPRAIARLPKRGFGLPIARWMAGPLRESTADRIESLARSGIFGRDAVRSTWEDFSRDTSGAAWSRAWMLAVLAQWLQNVRAAAPSGSASAACAS
jgi:asparagine synthase (glutamine-hydrolysing)